MEGGKETLAAIFFCVFGFFFLPESAGEPEEKRNGNNSFECLDVGKWEGVGWGAIRQLRETGRGDFRCSHGGFAEAPPAISSRMVACLPLSLRFLQGNVIGQNKQAGGIAGANPGNQKFCYPACYNCRPCAWSWLLLDVRTWVYLGRQGTGALSSGGLLILSYVGSVTLLFAVCDWGTLQGAAQITAPLRRLCYLLHPRSYGNYTLPAHLPINRELSCSIPFCHHQVWLSHLFNSRLWSIRLYCELWRAKTSPSTVLNPVLWPEQWRPSISYGCYCCSAAQLCLTLCDPMDCSTPGFPVLHHLLEFVQIHVQWVGDFVWRH